MLKKIRNKLYKLITSVYNPLVTLAIGNQKIKAPLGHPLRIILEELPQFGFNITRLIRYTHISYPDLKIIDIGANIGDTVAFIHNYKPLPILCIDGASQYFELLEKNTANFSQVSCCLALIGENNMQHNKMLVREKGTAYLKETESAVNFRSLENILEEFRAFKDTKFLKIDTDGYDMTIMKGAKDYIASQQPVLFFEYDPGLIVNQHENPLEIFSLMREWGYEYLLIYQNTGDYLISLELSKDETKLVDLTNYYMGRNSILYADICAFSKQDATLFQTARKQEMEYFAGLRNFTLNASK